MIITTNMKDAIKELEAFVRKTDARLHQVAEKTARQTGELVKNEIIKSILDEGAVATGNLARSISVTGLRASTGMSEAFVGSSSPYAKFVEDGVKAGGRMPPRDKIYNWMIQKGMEPSERGAYLISKKIAEKGIPARHVFEKGIAKAELKIDHEIEIILKNTLKKD